MTTQVSLPDRRPRARKLRSIIAVAVGALSALAVTAALALVMLTTYMHRQTESVSITLRSVQLAQELEIDLLLHARTADSIVRIGIEADLRRRLVDAAGFVGNAAERDVLARVELEIADYLASPRTSGPSVELGNAFAALEDLVTINMTQAEVASWNAATWHGIATLIAGSLALALLAGVALIAWWLRLRVILPLLQIADAMRTFGHSDTRVRSPEAGPIEVRAIAATFNEMADCLLQQRQNRLTFLSAVAHDLRNPLQALKLGLSVFAPAPRARGHAAVSTAHAVLSRQVEQLDRMVGDLVDAANMDAGRFQLQLESCDARDLARQAVQLFAPVSDRHALALRVPEQEVPIRGDSVRLAQVLNNLVTNAIKYSPDGGEVAVEVRVDKQSALFAVEDHGLGIAQQDQERLGEPFRRVGASSRSIQGLGLGLFVARCIVEAHGGRLEIESKPGEGTRVAARIPSAPTPSQ